MQVSLTRLGMASAVTIILASAVLQQRDPVQVPSRTRGLRFARGHGHKRDYDLPAHPIFRGDLHASRRPAPSFSLTYAPTCVENRQKTAPCNIQCRGLRLDGRARVFLGHGRTGRVDVVEYCHHRICDVSGARVYRVFNSDSECVYLPGHSP